MTVICAWCGKILGEKPPHEDKSVTHSICKECIPHVLEEAASIIREGPK